MRNFEQDPQSNEGNTGWEILSDDGFERRRAERANRRYEAMQKSPSEALTNMTNKVKALVAGAVLTLALVGGAVAGGCSTPEIMNTERAETVEIFNVESVVLTDGPNIRKNPSIPDREAVSNVLMDFGEEGQRAQIPYQGEAYYYRDEYSANGGWYGFPAEDFADDLYENAFISQDEANKLVKEEVDDKGDGIFWINEKYVAVDKGEDTFTH